MLSSSEDEDVPETTPVTATILSKIKSEVACGLPPFLGDILEAAKPVVPDSVAHKKLLASLKAQRKAGSAAATSKPTSAAATSATAATSKPTSAAGAMTGIDATGKYVSVRKGDFALLPKLENGRRFWQLRDMKNKSAVLSCGLNKFVTEEACRSAGLVFLDRMADGASKAEVVALKESFVP